MHDEQDIDTDYYKKLLEQRRDAILNVEQTGRDSSRTVELDQSRVGRLSRMDAMQGQAMSQATQRRREVELQKIGAALRRIEEGDYGYCLRCGEPIGHGRLNVDPGAPLCITCAENATAG
jgi:DnaK suppressor protein